MATAVRAAFLLMFIPFVYCAPNSYENFQISSRIKLEDENNQQSFNRAKINFSNSYKNNNNGYKNTPTRRQYNPPYPRESINQKETQRMEGGKLKILNSTPLRGKRAGAHGTPDIVFPDFRGNCDKDQLFCEDVRNYPKDEISKALRLSDPYVSSYFGVETIEPVEIDSRFDLPDDIQLCDARQRVAFPQRAKDASGNWQYIVNFEGKQQGVIVEECQGKENACKIEGTLSIGYEAVCKQKYVTRRLVAFITNDNSTTVENFKMPGCCSCYMRSLPVGSTRSSYETRTRNRRNLSSPRRN